MIAITEISDKSAKVTWRLYTEANADQFKLVLTETVSQTIVSTQLLKRNQSQLMLTKLRAVTAYSLQIIVLKGDEESSVKTNGFATNSNLGKFDLSRYNFFYELLLKDSIYYISIMSLFQYLLKI